MDFPLVAPPSGVQSNFIDPPTQSTAILVTGAIFVGLTVIMLTIRIFTRTFVSEMGFGWDDAFCLMATAGSITLSTLLLEVSTNGFLGRHMWDIPFREFTPSKVGLISATDIVYAITLYLVKVSLLTAFYRLFSINRTARRLIYVGLAVSTAFMLPHFIIAVHRAASCTHVMKALSTKICLPEAVRVTNVTLSVLNIIPDFLILYIPISQLSQLKVNRRQKIALLVPFSAGFAACCMSIVRLGFVISIFNSRDIFWNAAVLSIPSIAELNLAIMCSCMTSLPAFHRYLKQYFSRSSGTKLHQAKRGNSILRDDTSYPSSTTEQPQMISKSNSGSISTLPISLPSTVNSLPTHVHKLHWNDHDEKAQRSHTPASANSPMTLANPDYMSSADLQAVATTTEKARAPASNNVSIAVEEIYMDADLESQSRAYHQDYYHVDQILKDHRRPDQNPYDSDDEDSCENIPLAKTSRFGHHAATNTLTTASTTASGLRSMSNSPSRDRSSHDHQREHETGSLSLEGLGGPLSDRT